MSWLAQVPKTLPDEFGIEIDLRDFESFTETDRAMEEIKLFTVNLVTMGYTAIRITSMANPFLYTWKFRK